MNSLEIQYFLTIVKHGSFTEAAQVLSVSQPAISKQIRQLEEELGGSLFTRSGRTLSLTPAGQAYHDYFQQCRFQLDLLKNKLNAQKKDGISIIRIAYPDDVDPSHFRTRFLDAAASIFTPVHLEFTCYPESELPEILEQGRCDLILTAAPPVWSRFSDSGKLFTDENPLSIQPFAEISQVLLYAASCPESTDISCFQDSSFLLPEHDVSTWKIQNLYHFFNKLGFAPKIRSAANLSTILDLVAQNEGVYLTHAWCRACKSVDYQALPLPVSQIVYLGCHKTNRSSETSELFIQLAT